MLAPGRDVIRGRLHECMLYTGNEMRARCEHDGSTTRSAPKSLGVKNDTRADRSSRALTLPSLHDLGHKYPINQDD
eukprot:4378490-Amphidinium_carterae.1